MIELDKYEKALYYEIFIKKEYELLDNIIKDSKIVLDIGGHIGLFSLYCMQINRNLNIHFFEPVKYNFDKAFEILASFNNIVFNNSGIWTESGEKEIFINNTKKMQSSIYNDTFLNKDGISDLVKFIRLENYLESNNIDRIDLVKFDIEGAEFDILLNLDEKFFRKFRNIFFEYHMFDKNMEYKYELLIEKLKQLYMNIEVYPSKYTDKIGYVLCY